MKFSYRARTEEGDVEKGVIEASSKEAALEIIHEYGLYPTSLKALGEPFWKKGLPFLKRVSKKEVVLFARQLSILIGANIPVVESLETVARQSGSEDFKEKMLKAAEQVEGGSTLSDALAEYPDIFSPFYIGMIRSAEQAGQLPKVLNYLSDHLEKNRNLRMQLIGALVYPAFVTTIFFLMMLAMSTFVVPNFKQVFEDMGIELPMITQVVIEASDILRRLWWAFILFLIFLGVAMAFLLREPSVRREVDRLSLELPIIGNLLKKIYQTRIALNLSTLISSGVPISEALEITADLMGNVVYERMVREARKDIRAGRSIASTFSAHPEWFSRLFIQMMVAGEKTGNIEGSLDSVVDFFQEEVENTLAQLLKFIEPIMILILGLLVAVLGLSLFIPMFRGGSLSI